MQQRHRLLYAGFLAATAALLLFAWLAREILRGATLQFDNSVRGAIHAWASRPLTLAMLGITQLGSPPVLILMSVLIVWALLRTGRPRAAILLVVAAIGGEALDAMLKLIFQRDRPEAFFGYAEPAGYSFPSGHAVASACFYGVLAAILTVRMKSPWRRVVIWTVAALLAGLVGLSRIYLGVHYPSDVIAGYAAGIVWVAAVRASYEAWLRRRPAA